MATILHKRKAADPSASDLTVGELAINTSDGGVFTKTSGGSVVEVSGAGGSGGENNQNAWTTFSVSGQDDVVADSATDTCTFVAGSNVTLTTNASGDSITVASTDTNTTYSVGDGGLTQNNFTNTLKSKLDAIEASATADQTNAEIRAAVEAASDSNVFTDADHTKLNGIEASATADQTNAEIRTAVEAASDSNVFTDADHSKLNGIEASATADQSAAEIIALIAGETIAPGVITTTNLTMDFGSVA